MTAVHTATVTDVLRSFGAPLEEPQLAELLAADLSERFLPLRPAAGLTAASRDLLREGGLDFEADAVGAAITTTGAAYAGLLASALTVEQVARAAGVDASRIRHRLAAGELFSLPSGRGRARLVPRFQLDDGGRPLPAVGKVLQALPPGLHPLELEGFFTTPQPDLELDGQPASPRTFLASGGDAGEVVRLAAGLDDLGH